jgi:hypothetical protein
MAKIALVRAASPTNPPPYIFLPILCPNTLTLAATFPIAQRQPENQHLAYLFFLSHEAAFRPTGS